MRRFLFSVLLTAISPIIVGCSSSSTVSQYAGLPRDQLPRDHMDYRASGSTRAQHARVQPDSSVTGTTSAAAAIASIDDENRRLAKATDICRGCLPKNLPSPSYTRQAIVPTSNDALASVPPETKIPR